jgi:hypothetical protein
MDDLEDLYFEIHDSGDLIRLEFAKPNKINDDSIDDWDKNWIRAKVIIKAGAFNGHYWADFMTTDFELFKRDIKKIDQDFNGIGKFETLEDQLNLSIKGDGIGHFELECIAKDNASFGSRLSFSLTFDQTELKRLINELDKIIKAYPIKGDMNIKNE